MCKYWWKSGNKEKNIHWMSWERMCASKFHGGLGFRHLHEFNVALLGKQGWRIVTNPTSLVARMFKAKYFPNEPWLPNNDNPYVTTESTDIEDHTVAMLMVPNERRWDEDLVKHLFNQRDANLILAAPISDNNEDSWYWRKEKSGNFSVKTAYILIQESKPMVNQCGNTRFWKRMWSLTIPLKD